MKRQSSELVTLGVMLALVFLLMWILSPQRFATLTNLQSMGSQLAVIGLLSLGMMATMITGGIDLSIIAVADLAGIVTAFVLTAHHPASGFMVFIAIVAGLAVAVVVGSLNGLLIAVVGVSPILATLGTMILIQGFNIVITGGGLISGFPSAILFIGNGNLWIFPMAFVIFLGFAALLHLLMRYTVFGFNVYMMGSNPTASRFSGVDNTRVLITTYALSSLYAGLAGMIMISQYNSAQAGYGSNFLLLTILAAVLGGTSATGGFGTVPGLFFALLILQSLSSGLTIIGFSGFITISIWGIVILAVFVLNFILSKIGDRRRKRTDPPPYLGGGELRNDETSA